MSVLTSDDDLTAPLTRGGGRFTRYVPSDESPSYTLVDTQPDAELNEMVTVCGVDMRKSVMNEIIVGLLMLAVIVMGTGNSVASRVKGQAMGHFNFFASLGNAIMYVFRWFLEQQEITEGLKDQIFD
jgi:hypothetical protein